jgi:hypothetical protein
MLLDYSSMLLVVVVSLVMLLILLMLAFVKLSVVSLHRGFDLR